MYDKATLFLLGWNGKSRFLGLYSVIKLHQFLLVQDVSIVTSLIRILLPSNVIFSIQDPGIGIPEADQVKLFESFHCARNVGNIPGTGLGLAIVAKCIDLYQFSIAVNSKVGMGSRFIVTIPIQSVTFLHKFVDNTSR